MKFVGCFLIIFLSIASAFSEDKQLSLDEILTRHTNAIGGLTALQKIHSLRFHLHIKEPTFEIDGIYVADRDGHMRIDIMSGGKRVYTEAFDGKTAWVMGDDAIPKDESPAGTIALENGIYTPDRFFSLQELMKKGMQIELRSREEISSKNYYVLHVVRKNSAKDIFINPQNWLIERSRETKATHPDVDPTPRTTETVYSDFRKVDGILRSFQDVATEIPSGKMVQHETIQQIEANVSTDPSFFTKPSKP